MAAPYPELNGKEPCRQGDRDRFFPEGRGRGRIEKVLAECQACHALEQCLAYALTHAEKGIWGGTTDSDREAMRQEHDIKPVPVDSSYADVGLIIRCYERHYSSAAIAKLADVAEGTVQRILREHRENRKAMA